MATQAARIAIADAELSCGDVDLIVLATFTSDYKLPQAGGIVQANMGSKAKIIQVDAACSGFIDGMMVAHSLMESQGYETAVVIGADTTSCVLDPGKYLPLTVFGDGAGAAVVRREKDLDDYGVQSFSAGSDGHLGDYVWAPAGGSKMPCSQEVLDQGLQYLRFKFSEINPWAVQRMTQCTREALARAGIGLQDVDWVVPHQASSTLVMEVARQLELPPEMFVLTYPDTGNTSAASIPIALDRANRRGDFADRDWVVMPAVGAGMAWNAMTYRWYDYRNRRPPARPAVEPTTGGE
jgi:3-oxoacyl-[acyl-carrier-protein] synthase-3